MGRLALVVGAVLGLAACGAFTERQLEQTRAAADLALVRGRLDEAARLVAEGRTRTEGTPDSAWAWRFRLLGAEVAIARLALRDAEAVLSATVPDTPELAAVRGRQTLLRARLQVMQGQLKTASATIDEARRLAPDDRNLVFDAEILASQIRFRTGQWAAAEEGLQQVVADARAAGDHHRQAQALNNLGMGLVVRGRFDEALPWFEGVLAFDDLADTTIYGQALNNAGICYARLGLFERAVAAQQRAIEIHSGGRQLDYTQALGELGSTYFLREDADRGIPAWQEAFRIANGAGLATEAVLWARNLAMAFVQQADWDAAERYNAEATRLAGELSGSRRAYALVTEAQIAAGRGRADEARHLFNEALDAAADVPAVRWMSHDGLARLAAARHDTADAVRQFEAALDTLERTRSALLRTEYRISFPARLTAFYRGYVEFLLDQNEIARALEVADSSRARVLAERQGVAASGTRVEAAALRRLARDTGSTLLFYWLGPEQSRVWVVTGSGVRAVPLPPAREIEGLVQQHQAAVQNALVDPLATSAGARLYEQVVAPVVGEVPRGSALVIVPDGALHRLNFETLPVPGGEPRYWIEDVTVQIAPSLSMLRRATAVARRAGGSTAVPDRSLLLVGNPTPRAPEFPALSYAPAEMERIAKHFAPDAVQIVEGAGATPAAFRDAGPQRFSAIHFTSHAVANVESPLDSAVILSGPDQAFKLYAREVAQLPLNTDLVTVSACRSAGDRAYAGEGLVGFAWAFLRAGSKRVVAGLWDVDDRSTALLMDDFYARVAAGATPATALREAKIALIARGFPKPYYWAPFQIFTVVL